MDGTLSQLVTLTSAANGVIAGRTGADSIYPSNADFKFCNSVRFIDIRKPLLGKPQEIERHKDPYEWLRSLKPGHATRAWLTYQSGNLAMPPDHQLAGFAGGGGTWQLHVASPDRTEIWLPRWEVTRRDDPDTRIWSVTYSCVARVPGKPSFPEPRLDLITSRLAASLNATHEFASVHDLAFWAGLFQRAADCLDPSLPVVFPDYIQFVFLDSYPETAQRLLAAAYTGWVFGGMGSWNDLGFEPDAENDRYNRLSAELYSAVTDAIQQATWSFGKDALRG